MGFGGILSIGEIGDSAFFPVYAADKLNLALILTSHYKRGKKLIAHFKMSLATNM